MLEKCFVFAGDTSIITKVKLLKSKDIYNELKAQLICSANIMRISNCSDQPLTC